MRKTVSLLIFTVLFFSGMAQTPKNAKSVDSGKIANEGKILYDQGQYDEAEKKFKQIPIGDTLYNIAQYELALTYYATRRFEESLEISKKILEENDGTLELSNLYNIVGNTLSSLDRYEEAITIYDNALNHFPYSYLLHFNKGIVFMKMKDYANAATCFEEVVFLNALHQNSHFQLGLAYLNMGLSIQGILAINYAVLLNPASQTAIMSLQNLEQLYDAGIDEVYSDAVTPEKYKAEKNRMLKLENIVKANIFRQKDFKPISSVKHPAVYQNQIIFENITPNPKSKDVVNMLYIPYFQSIRSSNKDFDTYSLFIFSGTNLHNDKVSKMAKKKSVQISELLNRSGRFLGGVLTKGIGKENTEEYTFMYDNNLRLSHFGKMIKNQKGEMTYNGNITFLTKFGARESERNYIDGVNTGVNKYYYDNGELYQEVPAENNLFHGTAVMYAQNAYESNKHLKMLELNYNQGVLDGELKRYNISGTLTEHSHYKNGKLNGVFKLFYPQGGNYKSGVLKDGILTDWFYIFHNNGDTLEVDYYAGEEETGHFKSFYPNGTLETEGEITENTVTGVRK
ncbi:tetratricopeptide repeat protein, partial [Bacteroidales bacterium OttesenSCG-928-C03]|nr:tetratricopeptide repeat protein [Bacteroidales bacterium OttesenSCG-928-C03]